MIRNQARSGSVLNLGRQGENEARQIAFGLAYWKEQFGSGTVQLLVQRVGDTVPYPVALELEQDFAVWTIRAEDVDRPGNYGRCELQYLVGDTVVKSEIWPTVVLEAIEGPAGPVPEPEERWVSQVIQAGEQAQASAERAENAAVHQPIIGGNGNWYVWDFDAGEYVDTGVAASGGGGGKGWTHIRDITLEEDVSGVSIDTDDAGKPFSYKKLRLTVFGSATAQWLNFYATGITNFYHYDFFASNSEQICNRIEIGELLYGVCVVNLWKNKDFKTTAYTLFDTVQSSTTRRTAERLSDLRMASRDGSILSGTRIILEGCDE